MGSLALVVVLLGIAAVFLFLRRTRQYWGGLLFSLAYFLFTRTRLGYMFHRLQLSKKRPSKHSIAQPIIFREVTIIPLPILGDNYAYLVVDTVSNVAVAVDPSDPAEVKSAVREKNLTLRAILTTHRHWDHAGGNEALKKEFPGLEVYGGAEDHVAGETHPLHDKDTLKVGRLSFEAIWTPGHTVGHVVYLLQNEPPCLFTGDHIFIGGTGRIFECSAETMLKSLKKISALQKNCLIFPGHEYTCLNLMFANSLLPSNINVKNQLQWVKQQRAKRQSTVPSVLSGELMYNLFMFTSIENGPLKNALGLPQHASEVEVLSELRKQKNLYKA